MNSSSKPSSSVKNVVLLGSTGSIGQSTLKVVDDLAPRIRLVGLAAGTRGEELKQQALKYKPTAICIHDASQRDELKRCLPDSVDIAYGNEGLIELSTLPEADLVLIAIVGTAGLQPALAAIRAGKDIAIASKEILVMAGRIVMEEAKRHGVNVLAVDSEHSAIFQCLEGNSIESVRNICLTASGGPFRTLPKEAFPNITLQDALKHPSWDMGPKITIDSATMFNKGLEMIEAKWLFGLKMDQVKVVVHPQSVIHSLVEFVDGSLVAQLSRPDMCLPIQYALTYPDRIESDRVQTRLSDYGNLTFEDPDLVRFPAMDLARRAGTQCGTLPAVLNAANEIAVQAFVENKIPFIRIPELVEDVMNHHKILDDTDLDQILEADAWARRKASELIS